MAGVTEMDYPRRMERLRTRLEEEGCDAYFSLSTPNNQYLTGFRGTASGVIVTGNEARFLCDFRYTEQAAQQVYGCTIEEISGSLVKRLGERLQDFGVRTAACDPEFLTIADLHEVQEAFSGAVKSVPSLVPGLRRIKSPEEINLIRAALQLAEGVLTDLIETLEPGVTERELAARFEYELKRRGAAGVSFDPIVLFGPRSSLPHGEPGDRPLELGDTVLIDFGCRLNGYCSDLTRTYAFGTISDTWFEEIYELTLTAQRIAIEAARPGMQCRELDAVARDLIKEAGQGDHFGHGLGHGLGIEIHEAPRLNPLSEIALEPGMVITIEPGIYLPGKGGIRIEDVVAITDHGCTVLSSAPKDLRILGL